MNDFIGIRPPTLADPFPTTDLFFQIQLGNVLGYELINVAGENDATGVTFEDLSGVGGTQILPTVGNAESLEILSSEEVDTMDVLLTSYADDWVEQPDTTVTVTGTTPAAIPGSHFRALSAVILGPDGGTNVGDLIIRVASAGAERLQIMAGEGNSKSSLYSVASGKTGIAQHVIVTTAKNESITARGRVQLDGGPIIIGGSLPVYQGDFQLPLISPFILPQKTDIRFEALSANADIKVTAFIDILLVDNDQFETVPTAVRNFI